MNAALNLVLWVSAILDLGLAAWAGFAWKSFATFWFAAPVPPAGPEIRLLGFVITLMLVFFAALQFLIQRALQRDERSFLTVTLVFGSYLVLSSVATTLLPFAESLRYSWGFLAVDGVRGALLTLFSALLLREPPSIRSLSLPRDGAQVRDRGRLPDRHDRRRDGRRSGRGRDRGERGERGERGDRGDRRRRDGGRRSQEPKRLSVVVKGDLADGGEPTMATERPQRRSGAPRRDGPAGEGERGKRRRGGRGRGRSRPQGEGAAAPLAPED